MPYKLAIIGGGSSTFTPQLMRLFARSETLRGSVITLMDVDAQRLAVMDTLSRQLVALTEADLRIASTTTQREALADADFVITSISVGGFDAWERDIEIPARHGVFMPVADSIGPGGILRAFRHIPVLAQVAQDLAEVSPQAWVLNYSNPLSANCIAMRRVAPVRTVGLCTCGSIPRNARYLAELTAIPAEQFALPAPAAGLNHCAGMLSLHLRDGHDALPLVRESVKQPLVRWILETYGVLPYCWSHWTEFLPALCRLGEPYTGKAQGLAFQNGLHVHDMQRERERVAKWETLAERVAQGVEALSLDVLPSGEAIEVVEIIEALIENRSAIHVVNVPNAGAISNLPAEALVEVSCLVNAYGVTPLQVGTLPEPVAAILRPWITAQELTVDAALSGDRQTALQAFLADPQIAARLTPQETGALLDELLRAHAAHLPQFA